MAAYILRRLLLMIPTLLGIMLVSFVVVQFAPGGPVERVIAQLTGSDTGATSLISGSQSGDFGNRGAAQGGNQFDAVSTKYRGAQGLDPEFIKKLEVQIKDIATLRAEIDVTSITPEEASTLQLRVASPDTSGPSTNRPRSARFSRSAPTTDSDTCSSRSTRSCGFNLA